MYPYQDPALTQGAAPAPPGKRSWRSGAVGAIIGACVVGGAWGSTAAVSAFGGPGTFALHGTMVLDGGYDGVTSTPGGCAGTGGYSDIADGTAVTVYDSTGAVVASGQLANSTGGGTSCTFDIVAPKVPGGSRYYQVEVSHRGKITYSARDMRRGNVSVTLGG